MCVSSGFQSPCAAAIGCVVFIAYREVVRHLQLAAMGVCFIVVIIAMPPHKELKGHGEPRQECDQGHDDRAPTSQRHVGCEWVAAGARRAPRAAA